MPIERSRGNYGKNELSAPEKGAQQARREADRLTPTKQRKYNAQYEDLAKTRFFQGLTAEGIEAKGGRLREGITQEDLTNAAHLGFNGNGVFEQEIAYLAGQLKKVVTFQPPTLKESLLKKFRR